MKNFIIVLCLVCFSVIINASEIAVSQDANGQKAVSQVGNYSITFPQGWRIGDGFAVGVDLVAMAPSAGNDESFHENANVVFETLDQPMDLETYTDLSLKNLAKMLEVKVDKKDNATIDGKLWKRLEYSLKVKDESFRIIQYIRLVGQKAYIITFSSDLNDLPNIQSNYEPIVKSFTVAQ